MEKPSWQFIEMYNDHKLFHKHGDLFVYIRNVDSFCQICGEAIPEAVKFQAILICRRNGYFWSNWQDNIMHITDGNSNQSLVVLLEKGRVFHFQYRKDLQERARLLLKQYGFYEKR